MKYGVFGSKTHTFLNSAINGVEQEDGCGKGEKNPKAPP
jgi:hypothetical protein